MNAAQRYWVDMLGYDPANDAHNLASSRRLLLRLHGHELKNPAGRRACDDCGATAHTFRVGRVTTCRPCSLARLDAMKAAA